MTKSNPIQIIIVENSILYRTLIAKELKQENIETLAFATNGKELLNLLKHITVDLVLLDIKMDEMDGSETLGHIMRLFPQTKVIMLSNYADEILVTDFLKRGACAFINKEKISDIRVIVDIIREVKENGYCHTNLPLSKIEFTNRETELIQLMSHNSNTQQIVEKLNISQQMVNKHRMSLHQKTNTHSLTELLNYISEKGLRFLGKK